MTIVATEVSGQLLAWWSTALVVGLVVAVVVTGLLQLLLTRVRQIEQGADEVWRVGKEVARNTAPTWLLPQAAGAVEDLRDELDRHDASFSGREA
jgi:hypothetical protein